MIYFISDTHFNHKASLKFTGRERFSSVEEMNQTIIDNWNSKVKFGDTVYHLGDVFLTNAPKAQKIIKSLNGYKILIRGNHDDKSDNWYLDAGFDEIHNRIIMPSPHCPGKLTFVITHIPLPYLDIQSLEQAIGHKVVNLHGHLHLVEDKEFTGKDVWEHPHSYVNESAEKLDFTPKYMPFF